MSPSVSVIVARVWVAEVAMWGVVVEIAVVVCTVVSVMTPSVSVSPGIVVGVIVVSIIVVSIIVVVTVPVGIVSEIPSVLGVIPWSGMDATVSVVVWSVDVVNWSVVSWNWVNDGVVWGLVVLLGSWLLLVLLLSDVVVWVVTVSGESVHWDAVGHLLSEEDLGKSETERVTELVVVLVLPLGHGVHELVVNILSVDDKVVVNVEDEVPWVGEGLGHLSQLVEVGSDGGLALLELASYVVDNGTEVFDGVKDAVESGVSELIDDTTDSLPNVLGVAEALNTVWDFGLN